MSLSTVNVTGTLLGADQNPIVGATVTASLSSDQTDGTALYSSTQPVTTTTAPDGTWTLAVVPNDSGLVPVATCWRFTIMLAPYKLLDRFVVISESMSPSVELMGLAVLGSRPPLGEPFVSQIVAGENVAITGNGTGSVTISASSGGGGAWLVAPAPTGVAATDTANLAAIFDAINSAGGGACEFPSGVYAINAALPVFNTRFRLSGVTGGVNGNHSTVLSFAAGIPGIVLSSNGTSGDCSGSVIENLDLVSADSGTGGGTVNTDHGISAANTSSVLHRFTVRNVQIMGFGGDGINLNINTGNSVGSLFENVRVRWCNGNGFYINGANASVCTLTNVDVAEGGLFGFNINAPGTLVLNCQSADMDTNPGRSVTDGVTNGTATLTSATANFTSADVGMQISGGTIGANTSIIAVNSSTSVTMNHTAASGSGQTIQIHVGGALKDTVLGCGYLNFYVEGGQGSNCLFTSSSAAAWFLSGGWSSIWFGLNYPRFALMNNGFPGSVSDPLGYNASVAMPSVYSPLRVSDLGGGSEVLIFSSSTTPGMEFAGSSTAEILNPNGATFSGYIDINTAGQGLRVAEGSNAKQGVATLVAGTVTVANTTVTATSRIFLTPQDNNTAGALRVSARSAGTSFTITSSNSADTGVVAYEIFEVG